MHTAIPKAALYLKKFKKEQQWGVGGTASRDPFKAATVPTFAHICKTQALGFAQAEHPLSEWNCFRLEGSSEFGVDVYSYDVISQRWGQGSQSKPFMFPVYLFTQPESNFLSFPWLHLGWN